jgi:hypothetical protein
MVEKWTEAHAEAAQRAEEDSPVIPAKLPMITINPE